MPRCLMAKKWKAYPWPDRVEEPTPQQQQQETQEPVQTPQNQTPSQQINYKQQINGIVEIEEDEEIDVVGDSPAALAASKQTVTATCWGPSSPTAGATAPSPPPHSPEATRGSTILYNGEFFSVLLYSVF